MELSGAFTGKPLDLLAIVDPQGADGRTVPDPAP